MSKIVPNTFQTPNAMVDDFMRYLTGEETKCYLVLVRKIFGWHKEKDRIASSKIAEFTGLSEDTVKDCMKSLTSFGLVIRVSENNPHDNHGIEWSIEMDDAKINTPAMEARKNKTKISDKNRTEKMREKAGVSHTPGSVGTPQGGGVAQGKQKPPSTATTDIYTDAIGQKLSDCKIRINSNSATIINIWKEWFSDDIIIRALEMARGKNIPYADQILIGWKANGVPPTREQQIAAAVNQKGTRNYGNAKTNPGTSIQEPTEAERDIARQILARRNAQAANVSV